MTRLSPRSSILAILAALALTSACAADSSDGRTTRTITLDDRDLDGLLENVDPSAPGPILPEPDYCPVVEWRELYDADGQIIEICTQCLDAAGAPVGDAWCSGAVPPEPILCEQVPGAPEQSCWTCSDEHGTVVDAGCVDLPTPCESDADCADDEACVQTYVCGDAGDGGADPSGPTTGPGDHPTAPSEPTEPPPGQSYGVCAPKLITCTVDADCGEGQTCVFGDILRAGGEIDEDSDGAPDAPPPSQTGTCSGAF